MSEPTTSDPYAGEEAGERYWHRRYDTQHRTLHAMEDTIKALRAAAGTMLNAVDPYLELAAPHEELFSGRDLRNFEALSEAHEHLTAELDR